MEESAAKSIIQSQGYRVFSISRIPEGRGHHNFEVVLEGGIPAVARFEKDSRKSPVDGRRRDFNHNGLLSLEREKNLCGIVMNEAGLPAPEVYGLHNTERGQFMLVQKMPGIHWREFLERKGHDLDSYLQSLGFLGEDLAKTQKVNFGSYGDVVGKNENPNRPKGRGT